MKKIQNSDAEIYIRFLQQQPFIYAQLEFFCDLSQVLYTSGDWLLLFGTCILPGISNLPLFQFRSIVYLVMFCTEGRSLALKFYDLRNGNRIAELIHVIKICFIYIFIFNIFQARGCQQQEAIAYLCICKGSRWHRVRRKAAQAQSPLQVALLMCFYCWK